MPSPLQCVSPVSVSWTATRLQQAGTGDLDTVLEDGDLGSRSADPVVGADDDIDYGVAYKSIK